MKWKGGLRTLRWQGNPFPQPSQKLKLWVSDSSKPFLTHFMKFWLGLGYGSHEHKFTYFGNNIDEIQNIQSPTFVSHMHLKQVCKQSLNCVLFFLVLVSSGKNLEMWHLCKDWQQLQGFLPPQQKEPKWVMWRNQSTLLFTLSMFHQKIRCLGLEKKKYIFCNFLVFLSWIFLAILWRIISFKM